MMYKILANSVTVNGNTYRKGQEVSGVRFSSSQIADLTANKNIEAIVAVVPDPTEVSPAPVVEKTETKKK